MSFILDALRKADRERGVAGTMDLPALPAGTAAAAPTRRHFGLIVMTGALAVAVIVLAGLMYLRSPAPGTLAPPVASVDAPSAPVAQTVMRGPAMAPDRTRPAPQPEVRPLDREAAVSPPRAAPAPGVTDAAQASAAMSAATAPTPGRVVYSDGPLDAAATPPPATSPPSSASSTPPSSRQGLIMYTELALNTRSGVPPLRLDIHVYSNEPANRFVFVNNRKYREGDRTEEGVVIDHITPDGAEMSLRGQRFLLPRT